MHSWNCGCSSFTLSSDPNNSATIVQTYVLPRTCETQINSSDCAAERATELDNRSVYFQVIELLRITFSFMTLPEYAVLIHGMVILWCTGLSWMIYDRSY